VATRALQVNITGDASSFNRAIRGIDDDVKRSEGRLKGFGKAGAAALGGLGLAAGVGAAVGLKKVADASIEAEKSQARMVTQLRAAGVSFKSHGDEIDRVIQKHSRLAGLDDEELQDAFTNIVRSTGSVDKGLRNVGLAADIARAKQMDVAKAGELVGKVAAGNTGILARYGIVVKEGSSAQEALAQLQQKFAGQAAAYGKTTQGALDRASVASENLQEVLGAKLAPILAKAATAFVNLIDKSGELAGPIRTVSGVVRNAYDRIADAVEGFVRRNREEIDTAIKAFQNLGKAAKYWFENVMLPVIKAVVRAVVPILEGLKDTLSGLVRFITNVLTGRWSKAWDALVDIVKGVFKTIKSVITGAADVLFTAVKALGGQIVKGIVAGLKGLANAVKNAVVSGVKSGLNMAKDAVTDAASSIGNAFISPFTGDVTEAIASKYPAALGGGSALGGFSTAGLQIEARQGLSFIQSRFGGVQVSSARRSPAENAAAGGAPNSDHLTGLALDLVPQNGWTSAGVAQMDRIAAWAAKSPTIRWIGWRGVPGHGPGDHLHLSFVDRVAGDVAMQGGVLKAFGGRKRGQGDVAWVPPNAPNVIAGAAKSAGIRPKILWGLFGAESNFGRNKNTSSAGAQGPFQFMPDTARSMGVNPYNFRSAAYGAAKYLAMYKSRGVRGMLAAYNAGPAGDPNNAETAAYVPKVLSLANSWPGTSGGLTGAGGGGGGAAETLSGRMVGSGWGGLFGPGGGFRAGGQTNLRPPSARWFEDTNISLDISAAKAEGTEDTGDDLRVVYARAVAVRNRLKQINRALRRGGLGKGQRRRLRVEKASLLGEINSLQGQADELTAPPETDTGDVGGGSDPAVERNNELIAEQNRLIEIRNGLERQVIENQNKILAVATSQPNVIAAGLIDIINGGIGGRAGLGYETPSFAGGLARA
jgi:hypothetical protein